MKNLYFYLITIFTITSAFSQVNGSFSIQQNDFTFTKENTLDIINNNKAQYTQQVGAPQLPVFTQSYLLPAGTTLTGITSTTPNKSQLNDNYYIYPTQYPCALNSEPCPDYVEPDPAIYNVNTVYPNQVVEVVSDKYIFGYHIVTVQIAPFEYLPLDRVLKINTQINFTLNYSIGEVSLTEKISERRHNIARNHISSMVENPNAINTIEKTANTVLTNPVNTDKFIFHFQPSNYGAVPDYIIITNELLKPYFDTLATYKTKKGIPTLVVTVEQIYQKYQGVDNPEKIRNYLKDAHHYWGDALFVLLGGDTAIIPERIGTREYYSGVEYFRTTDMYYCDVSKPNEPNYNWNSDGDTDFGWDTSIELGADNLIGRAPVDTTNEAQVFINKVISYENLSNVTNTDYVNNLLFIGAYGIYKPSSNSYNDKGQQWHSQLNGQSYFNDVPNINKWLLFDDFTAPGIDPSSPLNEYPGHEELDKATTIDRLNNGHPTNNNNFHLISHFDHGGVYAIGTSGQMKGDALRHNDLDALANGSYHQILYTGSCDTGEFEHDCVAEHYVNATNGGGVAMLANSGFGWFGSNNQPREFFKSIYNNTNGHILGLASESAKYFTSSQNKIKNLTLFGEPSLEIWTNTPQPISLNVLETITIQNTIDNELVAIINPLSNDAQVTLYKYNDTINQIEVYAEQTILAGVTTANFIINPDTQGDIFTKVTAQNYLPAIASTNILLPQAHLYITQTSFTDGNGNGKIEQGESISLDIQLTNSGNTSISNIITNLTSNTLPAFVNITNAQATYTTIDAGNSTQLTGYTFDVLVTDEIPPFIEFNLDITGSNNFTHTDTFYLDLNSSQISLGNRLTTDTDGNAINDFTVDEEVYVYIDLTNTGNVIAEGITATLSTTLDNTIIEILSSVSSYPNIGVFENKTNNNNFAFKLLQTHSGSMPFTLTIETTLGKTWFYEFDMNEASPSLIDGFDFSSDSNNITISWNPVSNISGYNIYRSDTELGTYQKINDYLITGSSLYNDVDVNELSQYYYKISVVSLTGNELSKEQLITNDNPPKNGYLAWTSLNNHTGFPIKADSSAATTALPSPTVYDIDGNGTKEIFMNYRNSSNIGNGRIMGFYNTGQELFDVDNNQTEIWGFRETGERLDIKKSVIADINNDGKPEIFSSGYESKLYGFSFEDVDGNNQPDDFWTDSPLNKGSSSWSTPILSDLNNDGFKEIIVIKTNAEIMVFDHNKNSLGTKTIPNHGWNLSDIAVADMDNDGFKEIVIGFHPNNVNGAIYVWNHDGDFQNTELTNINDQLFENNERTDGGITLADIDNDNELEILTISKKNSSIGKIYALNLDGTPVNNNWNGSQTITIDNESNLYIPRISVGDLNNDGKLEVVFGSKNKLYVLDNLGNIMFEESINSTKGNAPILADIDDDDDIEIIINSDGVIFAYNFDGTECVGWRLESDNSSYFVGTPFIGDIDNDGINEIVISNRDCSTYVWKTTGDADKVEWESYRANPQNTGTYGEKCIFKSNKTIELTDANTTWNTSKHIQGNLVIKANASLTINSRITFASNSKLIVEQGAKLVIDNNAVLTNKCNGLWQGITVQGNRLLSQTEANQGVLEINNGAIIEHAKIGVLAANFSFARDDNRATGAIIRIDNAIFRDNIIGVEIPAYTLNNTSYIKNSLFETTEYLANINKTPNRFISLYDVATIEITDNTFINHAEIDIYTDLRELKNQGKGIVSFNAAMNVNGNNFENLYKAIETQGTNARNCLTRDCLATDIHNNNFINNWNAIYLNNNNSVKVTSNNIQVFSTQLAAQENGSSGMYILSSSGFQIEDNTFHSSPISGFTNGIYIQDCSAVNKIYKNYFNKLYTAIYAKGKNTVRSPLYDETTEGLQIICNEFQDNANDIYIAPNSYMTPLIGSNEISAGNTFNPICTGGINEFNNQGLNQINYIAEGLPTYQPNCNNNVNLFFTFAHNTCPSTLNNASVNLSLLAGLRTSINQNKALAIAITDGGNTQALNNTVNNTQTNEALLLRNKLLQKSPYLSDTIMVKTTVIENKLPSIMVKQVLAANPKAAKSSKVQKALDNRLNQLPVYMRNEINLGKNILSYKEDVESSLSNAIHNKENMVNRLIAKYKRDTTTTSTQLKDLLINESQERISRNYQLVDYYLTQGEVQNAQTAFTNIAQNFNLTNAQQIEYNKRLQLLNLKMFVINNNKTWYQLSEIQLETVNTLAIDSTSVVGMQSRAILSLIDNTDYGLPIPAIETGGRHSVNNTANYNKFEVTPKRANNYFIIDYALDYDETVKEITFAVYDNFGKKIITKKPKTRENQFLIECNNWKEGIYWCRKINNSRIVEIKQVIIKKDKSPITNNLTEAFNVYPNPTDNHFFVDFKIFNIDNTNIQITDVKGAIIKTLKVTKNNNKVRINTKSWQQGIYFVSLLSNNELVKTVKVVIK